MGVYLTIRDKPASSSRDEDIKLEGCSRMTARMQLGHPTCQEMDKTFIWPEVSQLIRIFTAFINKHGWFIKITVKIYQLMV